ncbi:hypothetical protein [Aliikangiella coralliicola]|uniref:YfiR family protein n=1 Tax=Aliikangiella coralliicola TaxID=2592383 RepID=A0A545UF37_9GAMM|nr:hypothetical protein [Aliikangiella coralliicola]TQV88078.1 hypothetical protein FLL46_09730 [Aliikangiella coralliicola]
MKLGRGKTKTFALQQFLLLMLMLLAGNGLSQADSFTERRAHVGLKLFRTLVSADLEINNKSNAQGVLPITLLYANKDEQAKEYQQSLQQSFKAVKKIPTEIETLSAVQMLNNAEFKTAAIFIAQPLSKSELNKVIQYGIKHRIIIFSPFEGDVEQGVLGGLSVQATVRPLINKHTLNKSQLSIKPFYLKVAKYYE